MSSHWLIEKGIGEDRAILLDNNHIIAARVRRHAGGPFAGAIVAGQLKIHNSPQLVTEDDIVIALDGPLKGLSEGAFCHARIVRETVGEASGTYKRSKPPRGRLVESDVAQPAPDLQEVLGSEHPVRTHILAPLPAPDALAQAGWDMLVEQASSGIIVFAEGRLIVSPTPGMTVIDVDSSAASRSNMVQLAKAAAVEAAKTIMRCDIGGTIAIDFPTIEARADRQNVAACFDAHMLGDFERTAINGFGLMQIVRRRERPSLVELLQLAPVKSALLALLRRAQRHQNLHDHAFVVDGEGHKMLQANPLWMEELQRVTGTAPRIMIGASGPDDYRIAPTTSHIQA
jgi:hypothetical protein